MVRHIADFAKSLFIYMVLCIATYLMLRLVISYTAFRNDVGFLRFKAAYFNYPWWKAAFYVHVFTAILAGFTQFSNLVARKGVFTVEWVMIMT